MTISFKFSLLLPFWFALANCAFASDQEDELDKSQEPSCMTRVMKKAQMSVICSAGAIKWELSGGLSTLVNAKDFSSFLWGVAGFAKVPLKAFNAGWRGMTSHWKQPKISRNTNFTRPEIQCGISYKVDENTKDYVVAIYQMMRDIDKAFHKSKVPYFAVSGTLLGCVRHGGFIPWDDDIDLGVTEEYEKLMPLVLSKLHKKGYKAVATKGFLESSVEATKLILGGDMQSADKMSDIAGLLWSGWRVERWFGQPKVHGKATVPFCDIFLMKKAANRYYYASGYPDYSVHVNELYPIKKAKFGKLIISVPNKPYIFLDGEYHDNWSDHIKKYNHGHGNRQLDNAHFTAKIEKMCDSDYLHAGPYESKCSDE